MNSAIVICAKIEQRNFDVSVLMYSAYMHRTATTLKPLASDIKDMDRCGRLVYYVWKCSGTAIMKPKCAVSRRIAVCIPHNRQASYGGLVS